MQVLLNAAIVGQREIVADDCTPLTYVGGLYFFNLTLESPINAFGMMGQRIFPVRCTDRGLWALQERLLNAPCGRRLLNG